MPGPYEPPDLYQQRTQAIAQRRQDILSSPPTPSVAPAEREISPLEQGLDYLGRPLSAISSAIGYGLEGKSPLEGLGAGITGQSRYRGMADVLEQAGVPELGKLETPFGDITGRGVVALPLDIFGDPISYIPAVTAAKYGFKAAKGAIMPGLTTGMTMKRAAEEGFRETPFGLVEAAGKAIPGVKKLVDLANPRQLAKGVGKVAMEYGEVEDANRMWAHQQMARGKFTLMAKPDVDEVGRVLLADGTRYAENDVIRDLDIWGPKLPAETRVYYEKWAQFQPDFNKMFMGKIDELKKVNPEAAKNMMKDWEDLGLESWQNYAPRFPEAAPTDIGFKPRKPGEKTWERARKVEDAEQGIAAGQKYGALADHMEEYLMQVKNEFNIADLSIKLAPLAKQQNVAALELLRKGILQKREEMAPLNALATMVRDAARGKTIPARTLKTVREEYPEIVSEIERLQSRKVTAPGIGTMEREVFRTPTEGVQTAADFEQEVLTGRIEKFPWQTEKTFDIPAEVGPAEFRGGAEVRTVPSGERFKELMDRVKDEKRVILEDIHNLRDIWKQAAKDEKQAVAGLNEVNFRGLKNLWFLPEDVETLKTALGREAIGPNPVWKGLADMSGAARALGTGFDLAAWLLQGVPNLALHPVEVMKLQVGAIQAVLDPQNYERLLSTPRAQHVMEVIPNLIVGRGGGGEVLGEAPWFRKAPVIGEALRRFGAGFDYFGDGLRLFLGDAMADFAERAGQTGPIGDMINHMTGVVSTRAMSVNPTQRAIESFFLFAPRYVRASLALLGDAMSGGAAGYEARRALASMLIVGTAMYEKTARALGQEPVLDPGDSKFMTIEAGGNRIGIGSTWVPMGRALARSIVNPETKEIDFTQPFRLDEFNPIAKFWRGRLAPGASAVWDLVSNTDYKGDKLEQPIDIAKYLGTRFLPFAVESLVMDNGTLQDKLTSMPAQFTGLRVFPLAYREQREAVAQEKFKTPFNDLDPYQREEVLREPKLKDMPLSGEWGEQEKFRRGVSSVRVQELERVSQQVQAGQITEAQWKEKKDEINQNFAAQLDVTQAPTDPVKRERWLKTISPNERNYQIYADLLRTPSEFDEVPFEQADAFLAQLTPEMRQYIDDKRMANIGRLGPATQELESAYVKDSKILREYWKVRDDVLERYGLKDDWDKATPAERVELERTKFFRKAAAQWARERRSMRRYNPEMDAALGKWYGTQPLKRSVLTA